MTNGGGAGMASFMSKKKKYKFQVNVCLEELLEVPFVSAVLFAKLRLLDGGNFQEHSRREEVRDHTVKWGQNYSFPCKMLANASTGVLERCVLRISVRKECKGGKSFTKLGFVDLNLAEYAGAGDTSKKALLEGYDTRHRQDNSLIKFSIKMNMLSGDILFKVPSPSIKHKPVPADDSVVTEPRVLEEFSSGSLAGSIASGSSGFGSLPKKRTPLLSSELVIGHTLTENNVPVTVALDFDNNLLVSLEADELPGEPGHSRNSSNTSQMSKASGYSSNHSHSRQSSSGDSGHIRELHKSKRGTTVNIPSTFPEDSTPSPVIINNNTKASSQTPDEIYGTPRGSLTPIVNENNYLNFSNLLYHTPKGSVFSNESADDFRTPMTKNIDESDELVSQRVHDNNLINNQRLSDIPISRKNIITSTTERNSLDNYDSSDSFNDGVFRSKSDFQIPRKLPVNKHDNFFQNFAQKSDSLFAFLTPLTKRRMQNSTPNNRTLGASASLKISPIQKGHQQQTRTISLNSLKAAVAAQDAQFLVLQPMPRSLPHRKLLEGTPGGKLAPLAISPDDATVTMSSDFSQNLTLRRPSVTQNPSSGSLVLSETGSLDRAKAALERRKKNQPQEQDASAVPGRVEGTRVNPDHLIDEIIKNTNLDQADDSAESSGLQLFISSDGKAALGSHEVKSQMSTGVFKQVVMEDKR